MRIWSAMKWYDWFQRLSDLQKLCINISSIKWREYYRDGSLFWVFRIQCHQVELRLLCQCAKFTLYQVVIILVFSLWGINLSQCENICCVQFLVSGDHFLWKLPSSMYLWLNADWCFKEIPLSERKFSLC